MPIQQGDSLSLYADYLREHRGDETIEDEQGFVTYRYIDEKTVYIVDCYIAPEYRRTHKVSVMADKVVDAAKLRGCTKLLGTVHPSGKNSTISLKLLLGYGMTLQSCTNDLIVFEKEI